MRNREQRGGHSDIGQALQVFRDEPYKDLVNRLGTGPVVCERRGPDGVNYRIEIEFL